MRSIPGAPASQPERAAGAMVCPCRERPERAAVWAGEGADLLADSGRLRDAAGWPGPGQVFTGRPGGAENWKPEKLTSGVAPRPCQESRFLGFQVFTHPDTPKICRWCPAGVRRGRGRRPVGSGSATATVRSITLLGSRMK